MNLYAYIAILSKTMLMKGKLTYTDTRQRTRDCFIGLPLDSECVTGHVLAENEAQAKIRAVEKLKRDFPSDLHYGNHENVTVQLSDAIEVKSEP